MVIAGGVALNSLANGKVFDNTPFEELFVPPVPDDSGCSIGAAFYINHMINDAPRDYVMRANYLGPRFSDEEIIAELTRYKAKFEILENPASRAAELIAAGNIIGWFQGAMEFGDRALGNRSILGDPRDATLKDKVNESVKYREPFRPFAPSILEEHATDFFVDPAPTQFPHRVEPAWIRAPRQLLRLAHAPFGKHRWHRFERRYLSYWMDVFAWQAIMPYRQVMADHRGARHLVSWHTQAYLNAKGLTYGGTPT